MVIWEINSGFEHQTVESRTSFTKEYDVVGEEHGADVDGAKINSQTSRVKFLSKVVDKKGEEKRAKVTAYKVDLMFRNCFVSGFDIPCFTPWVNQSEEE